MADEAAAAEATEGQAEPKKKRKIPATLIIVLVVAVAEAVMFYGVAKMFGAGPETTYGNDDPHLVEGEDPTGTIETSEIELLMGFRVPNDKTGQLHIYDFDIYIKVPFSQQEATIELVANRKGEISDRIARIVRGADPQMLHEPELKSLRLKLQHMLGEVTGDTELVMEVLIPRCVPIRAG